jgi:DNA-binding IclR family transcriptional regulator
VAAPVFGPRDALTGVLSLSGPSDRFTPADIAHMKTVLRSAAVQLTRALGGIWPGDEAG